MGLGGILQELKTEGVLALYHDYRSGRLYDWSGNGNNGTTLAPFTKTGLKCTTTTHNVLVGDTLTTQLTQGTLLLLADFETFSATVVKRLISKRDAGGTNYDLQAVDTGINLYDGTSTRFLGATVNGSKCIAVNFSNGTTAEGFINGVSKGNFSGASAIAVDDATLQICNGAINTASYMDSVAKAAVILSRKLTATEHARIYSELENTTWETKGLAPGPMMP